MALNPVYAFWQDTPRCFEQLLHWKKEVSKPKIAVCLASKAFVMRLLQDIMKEVRIRSYGWERNNSLQTLC